MRERTRLACGLAVLDGLEVVYLERLPGYEGAGWGSSHLSPAAGSRLPAHRTAAGKVLLAYLPQAERARILEPITSDRHGLLGDEARRLLCEQFQGIVDDGIAVNDGESTPGILAISAPVRDDSGEVIAALNLIASRGGMSIGALLDRHGSALAQAAQRISARLGHSPP
jgi:IclR family pca regulon transcriptional regulator